jgi:hypothetical protein
LAWGLRARTSSKNLRTCSENGAPAASRPVLHKDPKRRGFQDQGPVLQALTAEPPNGGSAVALEQSPNLDLGGGSRALERDPSVCFVGRRRANGHKPGGARDVRSSAGRSTGASSLAPGPADPGAWVTGWDRDTSTYGGVPLSQGVPTGLCGPPSGLGGRAPVPPSPRHGTAAVPRPGAPATGSAYTTAATTTEGES